MTCLYLPALFCGFAFMAAVFATGSVALRAPHWDVAFYELGLSEAQRRGSSGRQLSIEDRAAFGRIARVPSASSDFGELTLAALTVLSNSLTADTDQRRQALLDRMCERQLARVKPIGSVKRAACVWVVQRFLSRVEVAMRGISWLVPKTATIIVKLTATKLAYSTVICAFIGLSVGWITRGTTEPGSVFDTCTRIGMICVLMWSVGVLFFRMLVVLFGPAMQWSRRPVVIGCVAVVVLIGIGALAQFSSDKLRNHPLISIDSHESVTIRIMAVVMATAFLWFSGQAARDFLDRHLVISDRIGSLGVIAMMVSFSVVLIGLAIGGSFVPTGVRTVGLSIFGLSMCLMLISGLLAVGEWFGRHRWLKRHGNAVRGRRPLRWLLTTATIAWTGGVVLSSIHTLASAAVAQLAIASFAVVAFLITVPTAFLSWLYVRRVNHVYERHDTIDARPEQTPAKV